MSDMLKTAQRYLAEDDDRLTEFTEENLLWLAAQLAAWPTRVDEEFTTNMRFLMMSAAQFIVSATAKEPA